MDLVSEVKGQIDEDVVQSFVDDFISTVREEASYQLNQFPYNHSVTFSGGLRHCFELDVAILRLRDAGWFVYPTYIFVNGRKKPNIDEHDLVSHHISFQIFGQKQEMPIHKVVDLIQNMHTDSLMSWEWKIGYFHRLKHAYIPTDKGIATQSRN